MRRLITALAAMIMVPASSLWVSTPASAAGNVLTVVSSASFYPGVIPRGALISMYTSQPVSGDTNKHYESWVTVANGGLYVLATCNGAGFYVQMPILYVGLSGFGGNLINAYYPNSMGPEPWGTCTNSGFSSILLSPAAGYGSTNLVAEINTVTTHPGLYSAGNAPSGTHYDARNGAVTYLTECRSPAPPFVPNPDRCRVRRNGQPAELVLYLTGGEWYLCTSCPPEGLIFELAPAVNGVETGPYAAQVLLSVERDGNGTEKVRIRLRSDLNGGEYRLRVRNSAGPDIPQPLPIWFGPPA